MDFAVNNLAVFPIGKSTDVFVRNPCDDLLDDFLALASDDHVDIRATLKQNLDLLRCLVASDDCADLGRQLRDKIADTLELEVPSDADAQKIDFVPDESAERLRVLVRLLIPKVEECDLPHQVFHARDDVLEAGRRENPDECGRVSKIRVQCKGVLELDHGGIVAGKNGRCKLRNV